MLCVNVCASGFYGTLCAEITNEEMNTVIVEDEETGDEIFTDKTAIRKLWNACLEHNYISQDYTTFGPYLDKMILQVVRDKPTPKESMEPMKMETEPMETEPMEMETEPMEMETEPMEMETEPVEMKSYVNTKAKG